MLNELTARMNQLKGSMFILENNQKSVKSKIESLEEKLDVIEKAREIIKIVALDTQKQLEYQISEIVSLALASVFEEPYKLKLNFVEQRGKTEAVITFERNNQECNPLTASGGGAVDVACMALRLSLWSLQQKRTRNTIILDEPFKCLSKDLSEKAGQLLKMLSDKLGIQFILVTHDQNIVPYADKVFKVSKNNNYSKVEEN
jgi:DNA repair exonuclease SbcCD ATPase subunit